jgi:mono/diheme cytochrome c family protein
MADAMPLSTRPPLLAVLLLLLPFESASAEDAKTRAERHFAREVFPLFKSKCMACHGDDPEKLKGGLDMRTAAAFFAGGDSGQPPVTVGQPDKTPLWAAVSRQDPDLAMPPKENDKLSESQLTALRIWIEQGAPWPEDERLATLLAEAAAAAHGKDASGVRVPTSGGLSPDWTERRYAPKDLWAYAPLRRSPPSPSQDGTGAIDAFVDQHLATLDLDPAPLADRRTLIRRATFDLTGLPPKPSDIDAFLNDPRPDELAYASLVDRLLASPHYGEHWGRHWLDVVRYADSSGFANDYERGNTWRYRDYVIRSFNEDKPYDQFVREQLAGDEIAATHDGRPDPELLIAPGFLRMGPWELTGMEVPKVARQRFLDDVTDLVGQVFLGHTLQCARCHDHKFDPVPTRDFYAMQAVFATTQLSERPAPFLPEENTAGFEEKQYLEMRRAEHLDALARLDAKSLAAVPGWYAEKGLDPAPWHKALAEVQARVRSQPAKNGARTLFEAVRQQLRQNKVPEDKYPPKLLGYDVEEYGQERIARKGLERLRWELERYEPFAFGVYSGRTPALTSVTAPQRIPENSSHRGELEETAILTGGDPFSPGERVAPGTLSALGGQSAVLPQTISGRRLALAEWIASPDNPLTSRSIVNRVWQWHFGTPLAGNPNNFGATGKKPDHPALLDWLAVELTEGGWSLKRLHRTIMLSRTYQRSSTHPHRPTLLEKDPHGTSLAVFRPRRLTAEELRDAMLHISGELNPVLGGIPARPEINLEAALQPRQVMGTFASAWQPHPLPAQRHRRSVYVLKLQGLRDPFMEVFNEPSPEFSCEGRDTSNVTPQVFSLFNGASTHGRALALAHDVLSRHADAHAAIIQCFLRTCGRPPSPAELTACETHWQAMTGRYQSLTPEVPLPPHEVVREAVEENTGEPFSFVESLHVNRDFVPDPAAARADARTRGLADVCLVLFNTNEFCFVY